MEKSKKDQEEEQLYNHFQELVLNEVDKGIDGRNVFIYIYNTI